MKNPTWLKLLVLVLTFAMLLSLVACGPDEEETSGTTGGTQAEQPTEGDNETTDKGNDATDETTTESESASDTESEVGSGTTTETETETETDEETTTETDEETTTETDEETTTEKKEETTTEKKDDVVEETDVPTAFDKYFGPVALKKKTLNTSHSGASKIKGVLSEDGKYVHFERTALSGDYYTEFISGGATANGKYLVMKYRADKDSYVEIWANTKVASYQVSVDGKNVLANASKGIVADGNWQLLVVDLEKLYASKAAPVFEADANGKYTVKYLRLDLLDADRSSGYIDVEYVAVCDDLADLKSHIGEACPHPLKGEFEYKENVGYVTSCLVCGGNVGEPVPFLTTYKPNDLKQNWTEGPFTDKITEDGNWRITVGENPEKLPEQVVEKGSPNIVGPYMIIRYSASENYTGKLQVYANTNQNSPFAKTVAEKTAEGDQIYVAYKLNPAATGDTDKYLDKDGNPCALDKAATVKTTITPEGTPTTENCELKTKGGEFVKATKNVAECNTDVLDIVADGKWHVMIIDLNELIKPRKITDGYTTETFDPMQADENGKYTLAYLRFDAVEKAGEAPVGSYIEFAYVGFSDNLDRVKAVANISQDECAHQMFKTDADGNIICTPVDAEGHNQTCLICDAAVKVAHVAGEMSWNGTNAYEAKCSACSGTMSSQLFPTMLDKNYFFNKATINGTEKTESEDGLGIRFTTTAETAAGDDNGRIVLTTMPVGKYMIVKYKNSGKQANIDITIKPTGGTHYFGITVSYVTNDSENWQLLIVDLENLFAEKSGYVVDDGNGNFTCKELVLDIHNTASAKDDWIEYAYIGFSNNIEHVIATLGDEIETEGDTCTHHSSLRGDTLVHGNGDTHWYECQICGNKTGEEEHKPLAGANAEQAENNQHKIACACGYILTVDCALSGDLTFNGGESGDNKYHGACVCGREFESYFLVQKESTNRVQDAAEDNKVTVTEADGAKTYTAIGTDAWFYLYTGGTKDVETGSYVVIKYKTTTADNLLAGFAGSVDGGNTAPLQNGDEFLAPHALTQSEGWQILVLDLRTSITDAAKFADDGNGNYYAKYLRFSIANGKSITIDFVAFADEAAAIKNYIDTEWADKYTCTHAILSDKATKQDEANHAYDCLVCGETVTQKHTLDGVAVEGSGDANGHQETCTACDNAITVSHTAGDKEWNGTAYTTSCSKCSEEMNAQPFNVMIDKNYLANKSLEGVTNDTSDDIGVKFTTTADTAKGDNNGRTYVESACGVKTVGKYLIVKYKNSGKQTHLNVLIQIEGSTHTGYPEVNANYVTNDEGTAWHVLVVDLEKLFASKYPGHIVPDEDGNVTFTSMLLDIHDTASAKNDWIEYAYIGFSNDLALIKAALQANGDVQYCQKHVGDGVYRPTETGHVQHCAVCGAEMAGEHSANGVYTTDGAKDENVHAEKCKYCLADMTVSHTADEMTWNGTNAYEAKCSVCSGTLSSQLFLYTIDLSKKVQSEKAIETDVSAEEAEDGVAHRHITVDTSKASGSREAFSTIIGTSNKAVTGQYLVIKMRSNMASLGLWPSVDAKGPTETAGDGCKNSERTLNQSDYKWTADGWTIVVVNLSTYSNIHTNSEGKYVINFFRFDFINSSTAADNGFIDIAYMGLSDDLAKVKAAIGTDTALCKKHVGDGVYTPTETGHVQHCVACGADMPGEHSANGVYTTDGAKDANGHAEKCKYCLAVMTVSHTAGEMSWNGTAYATSCSKCSEEMNAQPFLATIWAKDLKPNGDRTTSTYVEATDDEVAYRQYKSTAVHPDGLGANNNDQYWTIFSYGANGPVTGQYFIMKYRNAYSANVTIYKSTTATGAAVEQDHAQTLETTLGWHVLIVDLTTVKNPITKDVDTDGDGVNDAYAINFMRFGFGTSVPADKVLLEVAYMGFSDDLSKVGLALDELDDNNYHKHTFESKASLNCKYCGAKPEVLSIDFVQESNTNNQQLNIPEKKNVTKIQGNPFYYDASATTFTKASIYFSGWAAVDQGIDRVYYQINNGEWKVFSKAGSGGTAHKDVVNGTTTALNNYLDAMCFSGTINLAGENNENVGKIVTVRLAYTSRDNADGDKEIFVVVENIKVYCEHQYSEEAPGSCSVCGQERYYVQMSTGGVKALTSASQNVDEGTAITDPTSTTAYNGSHVAYSASGVSFVSSGAAIYLEGSVAINGGVEKYYYQTNNGLWVEWTGATVSDGTEIAGNEVGEELSDYTKNMNFSGVINLPSNTNTKGNKTVKVAIAAMNADGEMFVIAVVNGIAISKVASPS